MDDARVQALLAQLASSDVRTRNDAISEFYDVDPITTAQPHVIAAMEAAYEAESNRWMKGGLGRLIKLRKAVSRSEGQPIASETATPGPPDETLHLAGGPRVFISYSFGNQLALQLERTLNETGFNLTFVDDQTLVGKPSLRAALEELVGPQEFVVPILDERANRSEWVKYELECAKAMNVRVVPVVLDEHGVPDDVVDIPYLRADNVSALVEKVLSNYVTLPLCKSNLCVFDDAALIDFMRREEPFIRCIVDSDQRVAKIDAQLAAAVERATEHQPHIRDAVLHQVRGSARRLARFLTFLPPVSEAYRAALASGLRRYGDDAVQRSLISWQNFSRLLLGTELIGIAQVLPPNVFPALWGDASTRMGRELERWTDFGSEDNHEVSWAIRGSGVSGSWLRAEFVSDTGGLGFSGVLPDSEFIRTGIQGRDRPASFIEEYQWADICLPQLAAQAVILSERFDDPGHAEHVGWSLADYRASGRP